jgi:hypothetical protein
MPVLLETLVDRASMALCPKTRLRGCVQKRCRHSRACTAKRGRSGPSESDSSVSTWQSRIKQVTEGFEQTWRRLSQDIETSGGCAAMIVTVEGRVLRVSLRGGLVIVLQQTAEPLTTHHAPVARRWSHSGEDQSVVQALVVALEMIVLDELTD